MQADLPAPRIGSVSDIKRAWAEDLQVCWLLWYARMSTDFATFNLPPVRLNLVLSSNNETQLPLAPLLG